MNLLDIIGNIERRILVNYRIDPIILSKILPSPFRPRVMNGFALGGICLIRFGKMRPRIFPEFMGSTSENGTHRFCVEWDEDGSVKKGVFVMQRFTNSKLHELGSNLLYPSALTFAHFNADEENDKYSVEFESKDGAQVKVNVKQGTSFKSEIYNSIEEASYDFETDSVGFSPSTNHTFNGVELVTKSWKVKPLDLLSIESSLFDNKELFPEGTVEVDHCLFMEDIEHSWRNVDSICCGS